MAFCLVEQELHPVLPWHHRGRESARERERERERKGGSE